MYAKRILDGWQGIQRTETGWSGWVLCGRCAREKDCPKKPATYCTTLVWAVR